MSSPYVGIPVCIGLAAAIIGCAVGLGWMLKTILYDARGDHTAAGVEAAKEAARKLDGLRPDGYTGPLLLEPAKERLALPPGPSARPPWDLDGDPWTYPPAAARLPMLDQDPPLPAPDETGVIPVIHAELGVATTGEFVAIGFAEAEAAVADICKGLIP